MPAFGRFVVNAVHIAAIMAAAATGVATANGSR